jgi:hypothetical protein
VASNGLRNPLNTFSQAHLYLNGTNWFTSVFALITRLSAALTRKDAPPDNQQLAWCWRKVRTLEAQHSQPDLAAGLWLRN